MLLFCPDRGDGLYVIVSEDGALLWLDGVRVPNFQLGAHSRYRTLN